MIDGSGMAENKKFTAIPNQHIEDLFDSRENITSSYNKLNVEYFLKKIYYTQ